MRNFSFLFLTFFSFSYLQAQEFTQTYPGDGTQGEKVTETSNGYEIISYSPEGNATVVIQLSLIHISEPTRPY